MSCAGQQPRRAAWVMPCWMYEVVDYTSLVNPGGRGGKRGAVQCPPQQICDDNTYI